MEELIAKRYSKALKNIFSSDELVVVDVVFETLADEFKNLKYSQIMESPNVAKSQKRDILLDSVKSAESQKLNSLIDLLVEHNRIDIIPALSKVIKKEIAKINNSYNGVVYSNSDIDGTVLKELSAGISKKIDSNITLEFVKNDFDGIKMKVEDLGIEIDFSKSRINTQIIEHILKAI
ncbi:F0F1 ATP synthase subunit delta [Sulfurimonas sp. HSL-1716]|uniref:F0F1 ATP synthase subunit delta n=1 Tax=Hydrocurvibacter sulfurireducens TaxID=3131937 RepID=UPI0031F9881E